jgi:hypothetical protein
VDDTVHYEDRVASLDAIGVGSVVAVSGVPADDKGGLRASRIDLSPRNGGGGADDDDVDVKGFVSDLVDGVSLRLKLTPESTSYYQVDVSGATADGPYGNGSYVEVRTSVAPGAGGGDVIATMVASTIHVEDRFGQAEVEVEGYVTSVAGNTFYVDGVQVETSAGTRYLLGTEADLVAGTKVEAEGSLDANGVLHARKVSFRPGVRITAVVAGVTATDMSMLGIPVQIPSHVDNRVGTITGRLEVRGMPTADGSGIVALRIDAASGGGDRDFLRAVATAKNEGARQFTVFGFTVTGGVYSFDRNGDGDTDDASEHIPASQFFPLVEPGRTVLKVRADAPGDVNPGAKTWAADEVEIED